MTSKSSRLCVAVLAAFFTTTAFAQDNQGTPEQRAACVPDAFSAARFGSEPSAIHASIRSAGDASIASSISLGRPAVAMIISSLG